MSTQGAAPEPVRALLEESGATALPENAAADALAAVCLKVESLARGLGPVLRAAVREALIRELDRAGAGSPAKMADAALGSVEEKGDADAQGSALEWAEPEPSLDPVDGAALLDALVDLIIRFVWLPPHAATVLALWVVHTWCFEAADTTPYLAICSATKRCGKSRLLEILREIVRRALPTASITEAALFRAIEEWQPTLLIDEADGLLDVKVELRAVINDGYRRGGGAVRCVGEGHEVRKFATYCPKAIALIGRVPPTTRDRGIVITMRRRKRGEKIARLRIAMLRRDVEALNPRLVRFALDNADALRAAEPDVPNSLDDRAADFWHPLLAIADRAGGAWPGRARTAATVLSGNRDAEEDDDELGVLLLRDMASAFAGQEAERMATSAMVSILNYMEERPWRTCGRRGEAMTPRDLATLLRPFGVGPKNVRVTEPEWDRKQGKHVDHEVVRRGYEIADLADVLARYGIACATPLQEPEMPPCKGADDVADGVRAGGSGGTSATAGAGSAGGESTGCSGVAGEAQAAPESAEAGPVGGRCRDCGTPISEEIARQFGGVCWNCRQNRGFREAGR